ncbi:MAG: tRNA preQ1(34) S-adenosylmethionine ribosyltransferase-isomerase QueA [Planctomycetota bacterium]|nr:MAG: tRNA preQ1(34) S-adenosylmethionine ribosyltransferase-isomerase QueA [Planctomycetota bacterium]
MDLAIPGAPGAELSIAPGGWNAKTSPVRTQDFDFDYPASQVAQFPCQPRDAARLMLIGQRVGERSDSQVRDLTSWLRRGDLLVLNTTKVFPARLLGTKASGGHCEVLLVHRLAEDDASKGESWRCMVRGRVRVGSQLILAEDSVAVVEQLQPDGQRDLRFPPGLSVLDLALRHGRIPLPPYIKREANTEDTERYQSVFAQQLGSVAAPTASLHFTPELLQQFAQMGVEQARVELQVGPGTFKPVEHEQIEDHPIHSEWCSCPAETVAAIERTRAAGGRVIAVGTTVVRTLESAHQQGQLCPWSGWTSAFLYPPALIQGCDYLLTNFHLPRSTLLALVSCLIEREELLKHYRWAIERGYRLFSYGDAMLVPNRRLALALRDGSMPG